MKQIIITVLALFIATSLYSNPRIHPDLQSKMNSASPNEKIPLMIVFNNHLSLNDFNDIGYDVLKKDRRQIVVDRLIKFSDNSQKNVRSFITTKMASGMIENYEVLWIINRIALKTTADIINQLSTNFPEVTMLTYDPEYPVEQLYDDRQASPPCWMVSRCSSSRTDLTSYTNAVGSSTV